MHHKVVKRNYYMIMCGEICVLFAVLREPARSSVNMLSSFWWVTKMRFGCFIKIWTIFIDYSRCLIKFLDNSRTREHFIKFPAFSRIHGSVSTMSGRECHWLFLLSIWNTKQIWHWHKHQIMILLQVKSKVKIHLLYWHMAYNTSIYKYTL